MVIFRENTEDVYAGIEFEAGSADVKKILAFLKDNFPKMYQKIRFPETVAIGIKPISREGTERLVRSAIEYAITNHRKSVTLVHKGNIMKFTEGAFRNWGYALAEREFASQTYTWNQWEKTKAQKGESEANAEQKAAQATGKVLIKDAIADITLQQVLTRPDEFDVIATPNLNGDYLSDALAAQVGGIGIAPGGNINYDHRPRRLRGDPRHRAQVRQPRQGQPRLGHPLRRDDAALPGLDRGRRPDHQGHGRRHRQQDRHLRLRPPHGRSQGSEVQRVRRRGDRQHVMAPDRIAPAGETQP